MPNMGKMFTPMLIMIGMSLLMINETIRGYLAAVAGTVIEPAVPFHSSLFVPTVALIGGAIIVVNTLIRSIFMDPLRQAHFAHRNKQLRKLVMDSQRNRDFARVEKVQRIQNRMLPEQMEMNMDTMRPLMFTMVFIIAIFSWMYTMVDGFRVDHLSLPWRPRWMFDDRIIIFPAWIFAYISVSAPLGRVLDRHIRLVRYSRDPVIAAGDPIEEPLLGLLREAVGEEKRGRGKRKGRRNEGRRSGRSKAKTSGNQLEAPPKENESCPACEGTSIARAPSGKLRCDVCREEWRR